MRTQVKITITQSSGFFKVDLEDHYGNYTQVYEPTLKQAMQYALYWCEMTEQRHETKQLHAKAVMEMNKLDKEAGILTGNSDGLD